jgi:hypothetical protein
MPHGGVPRVPPTVQAARAKGPFQQPGGSTSMIRADMGPMKPLRTTTNQDDICIVGVATCGSAAPVW